MKLTRIIHRHCHDPVYGSLDVHPDIKAKLDNPPAFIQDMIGYSRSNSFLTRLGLRVAAISARYLQILTAYEQNAELTVLLGAMDLDTVLARMRTCYPGGVETDLTNRYYCRKYAVCPWCRFRQAVEIGNRLEPHLKGSGGIAVIRISRLRLFEDVSDEKADYATLIRGICVRMKPKPFLYDAVVTVPNWYQSYLHETGRQDQDKEWEFSRDTFIIGILPKGGSVPPLPEDCVSEAARENMPYCGASAWKVYTPSDLNLHRAIGYAMRFSPGLLSPNIHPTLYLEAIMMQEYYRTTYHGFERGPGS